MATNHLTNQSLTPEDAEEKFRRKILFIIEEFQREKIKERRALGKRLNKIKNDEF